MDTEPRPQLLARVVQHCAVHSLAATDGAQGKERQEGAAGTQEDASAGAAAA